NEPFAVSLLMLFWVFGLGGCGWAFSRPIVTLVIRANDVTIVQRFLWRSVLKKASRSDVVVSDLIATTDSEGDPYFKFTVSFAGLDPVVIAEGHSRESVESERLMLLKEL
ncbi:MAG: hypothetical protein KDD43_15435, partial [Bdellovibrionales bacterium]|nr:hypothetical protein [Bdellovibrionales bacterium]